MENSLHSRFERLWQAICPAGDAGSTFGRLADLYGEPHRYYHTLQHIAECLELLDSFPTNGEERSAVEAALWFHDAIYDPKAKDNEERSAELAAAALSKGAAPAQLVTQVEELIMVTKRHLPEDRPGFALISDLDLSILGRAPSRYEEYCGGVRREYEWVSGAEFVTGRSGFLRSMLTRPAIFITPHFHELLERPARANMLRELETLSR